MWLKFIFPIFFVTANTYNDFKNRINQEYLTPCKTPRVLEGKCVPIASCPFIISQFNKKKASVSFILTGDQCGYYLGQFQVCCPQTNEPVERKVVVTLEPVIGFKPFSTFPTRTTRDIGRRSEYTERNFFTTSTVRAITWDDLDDRNLGSREKRPNHFSSSTTQRSIIRDFSRDFGTTRRGITRDFVSNERSSTRNFGRDFGSTERTTTRDFGRDFSSSKRSQQGNGGDNNEANHPNMRLLPQDICGTASSGDRITGGKTAAIDEYPWLTMLLYRTRAGQISNRCGGALISSRYVLTAAHCISSPDIASRQLTLHRVRLGEWDLNTAEDCQGTICNKEGPQELDIEATKVHPKYKVSKSGEPYDIALIRLSRDAKLNDFIKPICLPFGDTGNYSGKKFEAAGWGRTSNRPVFSNVLMKVILPLVDQKKCLDFFKWKQGNDSTLIESQMCAGGNKGEDTCSGDSGGPLMDSKLIGAQMRKTVVGIVSFGPGTCGIEDQPAVYTKVSEFLDWILDNMKS